LLFHEFDNARDILLPVSGPSEYAI